jgi:hypothetical protein
MIEKTSDKIIEYVKTRKQATANELVGFLLISERAVFKQLSNLIAEGILKKAGKPPKVFYSIAENKTETVFVKIDNAVKKIVDENFLFITPSGDRMEGMEGFAYWCRKTKQPLEKTAQEYAKTLQKYNAIKKGGLADGMKKFRTTFKEVFLDEIFYLDLYSIERFGKTKLGQLLLYAKQSQNKKMMRELAIDIKSKVDYLVKKYKIDGIGFIPPTVKREIQFMKELEKNLHPAVRRVSIVKVKTEISVPQKTLNKLEDRIENASKTIIVDESGKFKNILLIDDAVGSGATLNETAKQIRGRGICGGKIIGLSITGSSKGFDVISEV